MTHAALFNGSFRFQVGQKVTPIKPVKVAPELKEGVVYTVTGMEISPILRLEVINVHGPEGNFCACWFRPITENKTDISVFRAALNSTPVLEPVA